MDLLLPWSSFRPFSKVPSSFFSKAKKALRHAKLRPPFNTKSRDLIVYVEAHDGSQIQRKIPMSYLSHPLFLELVESFTDKYPFSPVRPDTSKKDGIVFSCTDSEFLRVARQVDEDLQSRRSRSKNHKKKTNH